ESIPWYCDVGPNDAYIQEMYSLYRTDPSLVGPTWTQYFERLATVHSRTSGSSNGGASVGTTSQVRAQSCPASQAPSSSQTGASQLGEVQTSSLNGGTSPLQAQPHAIRVGQNHGYYTAPATESGTQERVYRMISAFRGRGHFKANVNPLSRGVMELPHVDDINVDFYKFSDSQLDQFYYCAGLGLEEQMTLREIIDELHQVYCGSIGFEFTHLLDQNERLWLQERIENRFDEGGYRLTKEQRIHRLRKIIEAEAFESELHRKYVGHKRFSLQGVETVIPMLDTMLEEAAIEGVKKVIFGMPHRGRLNVLANILGKPLEEIFSEFEDQNINTALGSGDVKYHMGFDSFYTDINGRVLDLYLAPNPSHLEFVNPVVEGIARAFQDFRYGKDRKVVLPVLLHGDAAFAGQGVVYETINMSRVSGYTTGGTVHVIVNNQIGFTTDPEDSRSSVYCTDMAKAVQAPVFHVNCEDVESACWAVKTALDFRNRYGRDVIIDLYGYRKYGHNEGDDPSFTQPVSYSEIKDKKNIAQIYSEQLIAEGVVTQQESDAMLQEFKERFEVANIDNSMKTLIGEGCAVHGRLKEPSPETGVPAERLQQIANTFVNYPDGFVVHPKLKKILDKRVESLTSGEGIDWGFAETLAFGSLQLDRVHVRLSGQDCGRGTFSQRHVTLSHYEQAGKYSPLATLESSGGASFEVVNSTLSEAGVVGFEFGYSTVEPKTLVIWEAQFGDFANGAQVHIDQFISGS
ncbi:MAG: 2-oxoglutarate dehydrogenase E1 component, partial [Bdellovibrionales bacterium]|nr:2-oxoglutarate dehydrogenase E1 component [Bdellovibrionales bacterium]